jgi:hypothetical protein
MGHGFENLGLSSFSLILSPAAGARGAAKRSRPIDEELDS